MDTNLWIPTRQQGLNRVEVNADKADICGQYICDVVFGT